MKFNSVTWYSKLMAVILFILLPFVGFYAGMKYQEAVSSQDMGVAVDLDYSNGDSGDWRTLVNTNTITLKTKYEIGNLKYAGTVQTPTPCHELKEETRILESFPEQVQIRIIISYPNYPPNSGLCAQVITNQEFSGEITVSKDAVVSVYLDGKKVK